MVQRLQVKASQIGKILTNLEKEGKLGGMSMSDSHHSTASSHGPPVKKPHLKIGTIPPFNANKIRKSPSVDNAKPEAVVAPTTTATETKEMKPIPEDKEKEKQKLIENAMQDLKPEE
jgi:hypothetical protein